MSVIVPSMPWNSNIKSVVKSEMTSQLQDTNVRGRMAQEIFHSLCELKISQLMICPLVIGDKYLKF